MLRFDMNYRTKPTGWHWDLNPRQGDQKPLSEMYAPAKKHRMTVNFASDGL